MKLTIVVKTMRDIRRVASNYSLAKRNQLHRLCVSRSVANRLETVGEYKSSAHIIRFPREPQFVFSALSSFSVRRCPAQPVLLSPSANPSSRFFRHRFFTRDPTTVRPRVLRTGVKERERETERNRRLCEESGD